MDHPRPWLRYVDAKDLDDQTVKFKGLEVDGIDGEKLGKVEGFIVDVSTGRPYHLVVGAGSWFTHKHFLLPIGHVILHESGQKMIAEITQDRVKRFPGFDKDTFEKLSEDELKQMEEAMVSACCPDEIVVVVESRWDTREHYRYPTWWKVSYYRPERIQDTDEAGVSTGRNQEL
jgi:sporulation protein YlmC with PRC-barrel domain